MGRIGIPKNRAEKRIRRHLRVRKAVQGTAARPRLVVFRSLMLITALSPHVGYDKASRIAHKADDEGGTLREAAIALGVSAADFDRIVDPNTMVGNPRRDLRLK